MMIFFQYQNLLATPLLMLAAVLLDRWLGEPRHWHPLVGFGWLARRVEQMFYGASYVRGIAALCTVTLPFIALTVGLQSLEIVGMLCSVLLLYLAIAPRSLREHAERVSFACAKHDLSAARVAVGMMVSRDTSQLNEEGVARATVESVLENGNDAIFSALFWFVVAGAPGVVLYRLSNTLDAMWGYRNARYNEFGWAAARLDDALNFIPARLTAMSYALLGHTRSALQCWRTQAAHWESPNAGPVMAAGAGALQVRLGGAAIYHGELSERPLLGCGTEVGGSDISRAVQLVQRTLYLWLGAVGVSALLVAGWQHYV
jgi:adenosylcobinamide-phosphate synthase